jgi:hypothetical protein
MVRHLSRWLVGSLWIFGWLHGIPSRAGDEPNLEKAHAPGSLYVASDNAGRVAVWDWKDSWIRTWAQDGTPIAQCNLHDVRLGSQPVRLALRDDRVLLRYSDQAIGGENKELGFLVDVDRCGIIREIDFDGTGLGMESSANGWLLVLNPTLLRAERTPPPALRLADAYTLVEIDDQGKNSETFDIETPQRELARELNLGDLPGPMGGRLVAARDEIWFIPNVVYELWRVPQGGLPLRRVRPPDCLAAHGTRVTGEENVRLYQRLLKDQPEDLRNQRKNGAIYDSFRAAVTAVASFNRLLAVTARDTSLEGERVDVWDMRLERLVAMMALPEGTRLVALGEDHAWLLREGRNFERLDLPDLNQPLDDPCGVEAALMEVHERASRKSGNNTTPAPTVATPMARATPHVVSGDGR